MGRNEAILVDQIDMDLAKWLHPWVAVIDATTRRNAAPVRTALGERAVGWGWSSTRRPSASMGHASAHRGAKSAHM
jgi:hypothetical protein